ncbi:MAG: molybdopterin-dependent oxidoreductase [Candidatus Methanofastidiosia archaeon]
MKSKIDIAMILLILGTMLGGGCISGDDAPTTSPPVIDTFHLIITVNGGDNFGVALNEIKSLPFQTITATEVKKTGATFETSWGGTSLYGFFSHFDIADISKVTLVSLDGYETTLDYAELKDAIIAWQDGDGNEITEEKGGPIRIVAPGLPASTWIKWLTEIRVA